MNRTIKQASVHRCRYDDHDQLRRHPGQFVQVYKFGRRLNTLKAPTPHEATC